MSWKILKTETIESNEHLRFKVDDFETENGQYRKYWYHENDNAISAFVQKANGTFVMIREPRYLFSRESFSQVQGGMHSGEDPVQTALREIEEETGYRASKLHLVGQFASAPAFSKEWVWVYLAQDLTQGEQHLDVTENIQLVEMTAREIDEAIMNGKIWDGNVIAPWHLIKQYLKL